VFAKPPALEGSPVPPYSFRQRLDRLPPHRGRRPDPVERLNRLRATYFAGDTSLGNRSLRLARQSDDARFRAYRENVRWLVGGIVFVALNIPGSNNNLGRNAAMDAEHAQRMRANFEWLDAAVKRAEALTSAAWNLRARGPRSPRRAAHRRLCALPRSPADPCRLAREAHAVRARRRRRYL
jgi:hypothetical protein